MNFREYLTEKEVKFSGGGKIKVTKAAKTITHPEVEGALKITWNKAKAAWINPETGAVLPPDLENNTVLMGAYLEHGKTLGIK